MAASSELGGAAALALAANNSTSDGPHKSSALFGSNATTTTITDTITDTDTDTATATANSISPPKSIFATSVANLSGASTKAIPNPNGGATAAAPGPNQSIFAGADVKNKFAAAPGSNSPFGANIGGFNVTGGGYTTWP